MNPLIDQWLRVWDRLTNRYYRYRPDPGWEALDSDTRFLVHMVWIDYQLHPPVVQAILRHNHLKPYFHYRHFRIPRRGGGTRLLFEPDDNLKKVQGRILRVFLNPVEVHPAAMGFRLKKSIADHARAHAGASLIITSDLQDFFPATTAYRVRQWWCTQVESEQAAQLFTLLTTYRGSLPQGAPTSPALSNLVNSGMDEALTRRIQETGGVYTRYGDDMAFSWQTLHHPPPELERAVRRIVREYGYELHPEKGWCVSSLDDEPEITGVILRKDGTVTVSDTIREKIRELERSTTVHESPQLAGYKGFQKMVERDGKPVRPVHDTRRRFWRLSRFFRRRDDNPVPF